MTDNLIRRAEVEARTSLSKDAIYRLMREGKFPRSIKVSHRNVFWREQEITAWMDAAPRYEYRPRNVTQA